MDAQTLAPETGKGGRMIRLLFVIAVAAGICCKGGDTGPGVPAADSTAAALPDQEMWDSDVVLTSGGRTTARLHAAHIAKFEKDKRIRLDTVKVDFFNPDGGHASVLTARQGRIDEKTSDLEAIGRVVVRSDEGITLETDKLFWRNGIEKIMTDAPVKLTTEFDTVTGTGLESDPQLENWRIKRNISGTFRRTVPDAPRRSQ